MNEHDVGPGLVVAHDGPIGTITLARPERLNALDRSVLEGLIAAAAWFDELDDVKVVVVRGTGRAFSAGFDLADPRWQELGPLEQSAAVGRAMADAVVAMRAITIASIHGHCIGGGVVLAAACDLRIAGAGARFRIPEVDLGVPLYWSGIPLLARELGPALTKELVLTGRAFDAAEAERRGFLNRVLPDDDLGAETATLAQVLAAKPTRVLRETKQQVDAAVPPVDDRSPDAAAEVAGMGAAFADPEGRASAAAYITRSIGRGSGPGDGERTTG